MRSDHTRRAVAALAVTFALGLSGCSAAGEPSAPSPAAASPATSAADLLAVHGLAGLEGREVIDRLDRVPVGARDADLVASVRPGELLLSEPGGPSAVLPLPEDEFYLSVAPYVDQSHECYFHSLTTCTGELGGRAVRVQVTAADGSVLVDEAATTFDNGFVGVWLPRDVDATLSVTVDGRTASTPISTGADDPTCLTTLQVV